MRIVLLLFPLSLVSACAPPDAVGQSSAALTSQAATLPKQDAGVYRIAEWMRAEDCAGVFCDVGPAFTRAMADAAAHPVHIRKYVGGKFLIPAGEFNLSTCLDFTLQSIVEGFSGTFWGAGTLLHPPQGCTALKLSMGGSEVRDLALIYAAVPLGTSTVGVAPTVGIDMAGRTSVERLWIRGPTVGIIVGDANVARIRDVVIDTTEYAGVVVGPPTENNNANASLFESISVVGACRRGDRWATHFGRVAGTRSCAGIVDRSALGNAHLAHHGAGTMDLEALAKADAMTDSVARDAARKAAIRAAYDFDGKSSLSIALGLYSEGGDQNRNYLGPVATAIGGQSYWTGSGLSLRGNVASSLVVSNEVDPTNRVELQLGAAGGGGVFMAMKTLTNKSTLFVKEEVAGKCWRIDVNGSGSAIAGRIAADGKTTWK